MSEDIAALPVAPNPMVILDKLVASGAEPDKLARVIDLIEQWNKNRAAEAWAEAIRVFQSKMPPVVKANQVRNRQGDEMYRFADFADVQAIAQPILNECGIVVTFDSAVDGQMLKITCHVRVGTHVEDTHISLNVPQIPNANASQMAGAALSYGKRYAMIAALNIQVQGEDVDANGLDKLLDPEQTKVMNDLFEDCRKASKPVDMPKFWAFIGCDDMNTMKAKDFTRAIDWLNRKLRKEKEAKA